MGRWSWTLKRAQARSRAGKWSWTLTQRWTFFNFRFSQLLFGHCLWTLLRTAVETTISGVHKLLGTGGVPTSLTLLFWRRLISVSGFGLYGRSARADELFISSPAPLPSLCPPYPPISPSLITISKQTWCLTSRGAGIAQWLERRTRD